MYRTHLKYDVQFLWLESFPEVSETQGSCSSGCIRFEQFKCKGRDARTNPLAGLNQQIRRGGSLKEWKRTHYAVYDVTALNGEQCACR
jgi:hypothetical protein